MSLGHTASVGLGVELVVVLLVEVERVVGLWSQVALVVVVGAGL